MAKRAWPWLVPAAAAAAFGGANEPPGAPQTLVVDIVADESDGNFADGDLSLREAIELANANVGFTDTIAFNIPGAGVHVLQTTDLTNISEPVILDGYTQPGSQPNTDAVGFNAVILIEVRGSNIVLQQAGSTVRGLAINGASGHGIQVGGGSAVITGNILGLDAAGTTPLGNGIAGVGLLSSDNVFGGTTPAARNLVSGNPIGIEIRGSRNVVQGNLVGTDRSGSTAIANSQHGVSVRTGLIGDSSANQIGGSAPGAGNVISGNPIGIGLRASGGLGFVADTVIRGNHVGTNAAGTAALPNSVGILVDVRAPRTVIGGTAAGEGNLISGNTNEGIALGATYSDCATGQTFTATGGDVVKGNRIGTNAAGTAALPNGSNGITISSSGAAVVTIGGTEAGAGNLIAFNTLNGVQVRDASHAELSANRLFGNGGLGIDLGGDCAATPNDVDDPDVGASGLQNAPVLSGATLLIEEDGADDDYTVTVAGTLNGTPGGSFRVELFASDAAGPSGKDFLAATVVDDVDSDGDVSFEFTLQQTNGTDALPIERWLTATATLLSTSDTSEFSAPVQGPSLTPPVAYPGVLGKRPFALADFDGDGKADLVSVVPKKASVLVRLGGGDGTFETQGTLIATGKKPVAVAAHDFDGDGNVDLAVLNAGAKTVTVHAGDGAGGFAAPTTIPLGFKAADLSVHDADGDGRADLVLRNKKAGTVGVAFANADGSFSATPVGVLFKSKAKATVGDFDGDGRADVVTLNGKTGEVELRPGLQAGGFGPPTVPDELVFPKLITSGDFDADRRADLLIYDAKSYLAWIYQRDGDASFAAGASFRTEGKPKSAVVVDFSGDDRGDLIAVQGKFLRIAVSGQGGLSQAVGSPFALPTKPTGVLVADLDDDDDLDVLVLFKKLPPAAFLGDGAGGFVLVGGD